jgi:flavodoxin
MISRKDLSRRAILAASALLPVTAGTTSACAESEDAPQRLGSKMLVASFTRSGNTRVIAGTVHRALGTDLFEIRPARSYPEDYEETVKQAEQERVGGYEPPLERTVPHIETYEAVFLGFPIWGETAPAVIRSFLHTHDLKGKVIRPFITHGGYRFWRAMPQAELEPGFRTIG